MKKETTPVLIVHLKATVSEERRQKIWDRIVMEKEKGVIVLPEECTATICQLPQEEKFIEIKMEDANGTD